MENLLQKATFERICWPLFVLYFYMFCNTIFNNLNHLNAHPREALDELVRLNDLFTGLDNKTIIVKTNLKLKYTDQNDVTLITNEDSSEITTKRSVEGKNFLKVNSFEGPEKPNIEISLKITAPYLYQVHNEEIYYIDKGLEFPKGTLLKDHISRWNFINSNLNFHQKINFDKSYVRFPSNNPWKEIAKGKDLFFKGKYEQLNRNYYTFDGQNTILEFELLTSYSLYDSQFTLDTQYIDLYYHIAIEPSESSLKIRDSIKKFQDLPPKNFEETFPSLYKYSQRNSSNSFEIAEIANQLKEEVKNLGSINFGLFQIMDITIIYPLASFVIYILLLIYLIQGKNKHNRDPFTYKKIKMFKSGEPLFYIIFAAFFVLPIVSMVLHAYQFWNIVTGSQKWILIIFSIFSIILGMVCGWFFWKLRSLVQKV